MFHALQRMGETGCENCAGRMAAWNVGCMLTASGKVSGRKNLGSDVYRGHFVDGKPHGEWVEDSGSWISRGQYVDGEKHGEWMDVFTYSGDMERGTYVNGKKHGKWEEWDAGMLSGARVECGLYVDDKRHGKWELIFENGVTVNRCFAHGEKVACETDSNP